VTKRHVTEIVPSGALFEARCSCGWAQAASSRAIADAIAVGHRGYSPDARVIVSPGSPGSLVHDDRSRRCLGECKQIGLCSVDCGIAPWNQDVPYLTGPAARFKLLLRLRRWLGMSIDHRDVTWVSHEGTWRWR
jgi:hypothetical protein